jgi:hypothetical protein
MPRFTSLEFNSGDRPVPAGKDHISWVKALAGKDHISRQGIGWQGSHLSVKALAGKDRIRHNAGRAGVSPGGLSRAGVHFRTVGRRPAKVFRWPFSPDVDCLQPNTLVGLDRKPNSRSLPVPEWSGIDKNRAGVVEDLDLSIPH